ncbi:hypothetical protein N7513_008320 [Penicillium frequentans]|nr:hypothetical protein N7513_008320 [Penicillium glabrum]
MATTSTSHNLELTSLPANTIHVEVNEDDDDDDDGDKYYLAIGTAFLLGLILMMLGACFVLGAISSICRDGDPFMDWSAALLTGTFVGFIAVVGLFFLAIGMIILGISMSALYSSCCSGGNHVVEYQSV